MNARTVDAVDTQRVGAAVHLAVRRAVSEMVTVGNRQALEVSIGRRLQGAYGAQLRALAASAPDLSVAELAEQVIFAAEYPNDITDASIYNGDRDKARAKRYGPFLEEQAESLTDAVIWCAGVLKAKSAISEPVTRLPEPVPPISDELATQVTKARAALVAGREQGAMDRQRRRRMAF